MYMSADFLDTNNLLLQITYLYLVNRLTNKTLKNFMLCLYYQAYMLLGNSRKGLIYVFLEVIFF